MERALLLNPSSNLPTLIADNYGVVPGLWRALELLGIDEDDDEVMLGSFPTVACRAASTNFVGPVLPNVSQPAR
jgi:hypothetical protein